MNPLKRIQTPFFVILSLYAVISLARAMGIDMFFDGLIYSSIARNMAEGIGSFWHPYYSEYFLNPFYEHPPLAMWLQSLGFRLFGDLWQLEFYWGFALGLITILFIKKIWDELNPEGLRIDSSWLAILLFISIPSVTWTFSNNLLENTLIVFTTISAFCAIRALNHKLGTKVFMWSMLSGVFTLLGFLTKGFPALFVFAVPFFYLLTVDRKSFLKVLSSTLIMLLSFGFFLSLLNLASHGEFYTFFNRYINDQVLKSIAGKNENIRYFYLVHRFIGEIVVPIAIAIVLSYFLREKSKTKIVPKNLDDRKKFWFFLFIALSASLPMFFVPKQRAWYLFPSFIFYALAFAQLIKTKTLKLNTIILNNKKIKIPLIILSIIFLILSVLFTTEFSGIRFKRNPYFYKDILSNKEISFKIGDTAHTCPDNIADNWEITAYMQRYYGVNLLGLSKYKSTKNKNATKNPLMIFTDTDVPEYKNCVIPKNCKLINIHKQDKSNSTKNKIKKEHQTGDLRYELYKCN